MAALPWLSGQWPHHRGPHRNIAGPWNTAGLRGLLCAWDLGDTGSAGEQGRQTSPTQCPLRRPAPLARQSLGGWLVHWGGHAGEFTMGVTFSPSHGWGWSVDHPSQGGHGLRRGRPEEAAGRALDGARRSRQAAKPQEPRGFWKGRQGARPRKGKEKQGSRAFAGIQGLSRKEAQVRAMRSGVARQSLDDGDVVRVSHALILTERGGRSRGVYDRQTKRE